MFCVKGRFSGFSGIKTDHVWPEIRPLGFKGLSSKGGGLTKLLLKLTDYNTIVLLIATTYSKKTGLMAEKFNDLVFRKLCQGLKLWVDHIYYSIAKLVVHVKREG